MARKPRKYSESGIYHVILRGINREKIFEDDCEKEKLLQLFNKYFVGDSKERQTQQNVEIKKHQGRLYAFCILNNHIHLLLKESQCGISDLMKRIGTAYALFYNHRHGRSGPVFESRYTSKPVETQKYFSVALKYIHNNPVKAGIVKNISLYKWSSMPYLLDEQSNFLMRNFVMGNLTKNEFESSMALNYDDDCLLKCSWPIRVSDLSLIHIIESFCKEHKLSRKNVFSHTKEFISIVRQLLSIHGTTKAQISRLLFTKPYFITNAITH